MVWNRFTLALIVIYVLALGLAAHLAARRRLSGSQYLNATAALPLWVCLLASVAANCGSLDVIAMTALGAQYGLIVCHFYWLGAIPALLFLIFWLMPAYAERRYTSILDFIDRAYGSATREAVAFCVAMMMLLLAGVCLGALTQILATMWGWSFLPSALLLVVLVLSYIWSGGLSATIYTELLHFGVIVAAVAPLLFLVFHQFGGLHRLLVALPPQRAHLWQTLPWYAPQAPVDRIGLIFGLGLVLSFGYWSTDFVLLQRALAVRNARDVPFVPLTQAAAKLVFAFLIVLPGVAAPLVLGSSAASGWNATLPALMLHYYSPLWATLGGIGLLACLVSTFANNVSGVSAAWLEGIYRMRRAPGAELSLRLCRLTNATVLLLSIATSWLALHYQSLMDYVQMIFSIFNAPLLALVLLAALVPARVRGGGLAGLTFGLASAVFHQILAREGVLHYGSQMNANFYAAALGFSVALPVTLAVAAMRPVPLVGPPLQSIAFRLPARARRLVVAAALLLATATIWLNCRLW